MIAPVLLIGLILRLVSLDQSLWLDEGINATFARSLSYSKLIFSYPLGDFHPPLYHVILKSFISLFGSSEISLRIPSVILGVMTVFITYLIGKKLYDKKTGVIAALLIATGPLHIYYSQEARMYMLAAFLASLSVYFFVSLLIKDRLLLWVGFILSTALMLYSDYLPYILLPVYVLFLIVSRKKFAKNTLKSFIPAFLLILLLIVPWLLMLPQQLKVGLSASAASPAWSGVVGSSSIKDLGLAFVKFAIGRISNDNNLSYALLFLPIGLYFSFLFLISTLRLTRIRSFLWFYLLLPPVVAFLISFFVPVFSYFRMLFILPAFYILLAAGINNINWSLPTRTFLSLALIINLTSTFIYFANPKFQREDWKNATKYVTANSDSKTLVLFESNFSMPPFDYYNNGAVEARGALESFDPTQGNVVQNITSYTQNKNKVFLFQYLSPITDPQGFAFQSLIDLHFINTKTDNFQGVGFVYEFVK
ncbi:MAG: glycosyltransferase family 39 protein [Patescibacteria group bacterium]